MAYRLFIRPNPVESDLFHFEWALYTLTGQQQIKGESFSVEEIEQALIQNGIDEVKIVGLVPAQYVLSIEANVPGKQMRMVKQALPYVVEEYLSEDIDLQHLAIGSKLASGGYAVWVINRAIFQPFYDVFTQFDQPVELITTDAALIGLVDTDYACVIDGDDVLFKGNMPYIGRFSRHNFSLFLDAILATVDEEKKLRVFVANKQLDQVQIAIADWQQKANLKVDVVPHELSSNFELLCEAWYQNDDHGIALNQDDFQTAQQSNNPLMKWKPVAAVAAVWFILQIGLFIGQGIYYKKQADYYAAVSLKTYKTLFPSDRSVTAAGVERRLKGRLRQLSSQGSDLGFLSLLGEVGYQYTRLPNNNSVEFTSLNYSDQRGELSVGLNVSNFEQLNSYKAALDKAGVTTKIVSAVQDKGQVRSRISISGG